MNDETNGPEPTEGNGAAPSSEPGQAESAPAASELEQAEQPAGPEPDPLEAAQSEVARIRDQLLRTAADFDNFRKRTRRELTDAEHRGREELLRELLPVFDNLERATSHAETASDVQSLADGIRMVMRQFNDAIGRLGIQRIDAEGAVFDPAVMEAIQQLETTEYPAGTVAAQVQAGYRMGERLIRPAMVVVAKAPPA